MAEFKLSYTASEIDRKLGKVDTLVSTVNGVAPDVNGNVEVASGGIIDVLELPTENISESAFYRLMTAKFAADGHTAEEFGQNWVCKCVNALPEVGDVCTDAEMSYLLAYYNISDGDCYGYLNDVLGAGFGVPAGWYPLSMLCQVAEFIWGGTITDIADCPDDGALYLLLGYDVYTYKNEWTKLIFASEKASKIDIQWDGEIGDRVALDMSVLGYSSGTYFVKVSDDVFTMDELAGATVEISLNDGSYESGIAGTDIYFNPETYPGAFTIGDYVVVVHSQDDLAAALGIPAGIYTNGVYFWLYTEQGYTSRLTAPARITKIDQKYLDLEEINDNLWTLENRVNNLANNTPSHAVLYTYQSLSSSQQQTARNNIDVYSKSEVNTKIANAGTNVDLSGYAKITDVETMIANAIGSAIGGSY